MSKRIVLSSDHAAIELRQAVAAHVAGLGFEGGQVLEGPPELGVERALGPGGGLLEDAELLALAGFLHVREPLPCEEPRAVEGLGGLVDYIVRKETP